MHGCVHVHPVRAHAGLPAVAELRGHEAVHRRVHVGILEHDEGRIAAQLQRELLERVRAAPRQVLAHGGGAGEGDLAHARVIEPGIDHLGRVRTRGGDDVEHARRNARFLGQRDQRERGQGRVLRGLADHRAAGGQGRGDLARDHRGGEVPRGDGGHHAHGLLEREHAPAGHGRGDDLAVHARGLLPEPFDVAGGIGDLALAFGQGLALLQGDERAEPVLMGQD